MSRYDLEDLLWQLADTPSDPASESSEDSATQGDETSAGRQLPDAVLEAYREGRLDPADAQRVERTLAESPEARQRLVQSSEMTQPPGLEQVRRRLLARWEAPAPPPRWSLRPGWLAVAALLVTTVGLGLWLTGPSVPPLPPLPAVEVSLDGPAMVRGEGTDADPAGTRTTTATPDTPITVGIRVDPARAGLAVALYLHDTDTGHLQRLTVPVTWKDRSTAVFRAPARDLVGERPGVHELYAVVAWEEHLPSPGPLAAGQSAVQALGGPFSDVSPLTLEIVHDSPPDSAGDFFSSSDLSDKEARSP